MVGYDSIKSTTIIWQGLSVPMATDVASSMVQVNGSMIITTFGWEDDDNISTSHVVLLFGDQHLAVLTSRLEMRRLERQ